MPKTHQLKTGTQVDLADCSTSGSDFHDERSAAEKKFKQLRRQFIEQQHAWYAEGRRKLLIVLQAMDAGGKDGTIRLMTRGVNPQGVRVTSFKKPYRNLAIMRVIVDTVNGLNPQFPEAEDGLDSVVIE